ncbi:hypothetical protein ACFL4W_02250 [Planctomycetota bacterium]
MGFDKRGALIICMIALVIGAIVRLLAAGCAAQEETGSRDAGETDKTIETDKD